jgi:hypothetical protein
MEAFPVRECWLRLLAFGRPISGPAGYAGARHCHGLPAPRAALVGY